MEACFQPCLTFFLCWQFSYLERPICSDCDVYVDVLSTLFNISPLLAIWLDRFAVTVMSMAAWFPGQSLVYCAMTRERNLCWSCTKRQLPTAGWITDSITGKDARLLFSSSSFHHLQNWFPLFSSLFLASIA